MLQDFSSTLRYNLEKRFKKLAKSDVLKIKKTENAMKIGFKTVHLDHQTLFGPFWL